MSMRRDTLTVLRLIDAYPGQITWPQLRVLTTTRGIPETTARRITRGLISNHLVHHHGSGVTTTARGRRVADQGFTQTDDALKHTATPRPPMGRRQDPQTRAYVLLWLLEHHGGWMWSQDILDETGWIRHQLWETAARVGARTHRTGHKTASIIIHPDCQSHPVSTNELAKRLGRSRNVIVAACRRLGVTYREFGVGVDDQELIAEHLAGRPRRAAA